MDADYDILEIVTIVRDFWLIDAESYQRRYSTKHRQPLTPGYYVVNWPEHIRARRFNEDATFHGPFKLRDEARAALGKMHEERECVFTLLPERELAAVPNASQIAVKKAA